MAKEKTDSNKSNNTVKIILIIVAIVLVAIMIIPAILFSLLGILISGIDTSSTASSSGNVAIIPITGTILTSGSPWDSSITVSSNTVELIEEVSSDSSIKAVIFEINSPGGSGVASDEIATAIKNINKPSVAYIREVGASGSYWVASATDYIFANKFSTVGSIGVIASYLEFSGLLQDYNVTYQRFVAGDNKDFGSPFREPTNQERQQFQELLDSLHSIFITEVAQNRNLSVDYVSTLADGSIFTGLNAVENKLVDEIGGKSEAIAYLEEELNIKAKPVYYGREASLFDFLGGFKSEGMYNIGQGIGDAITPEKQSGFRT